VTEPSSVIQAVPARSGCGLSALGVAWCIAYASCTAPTRCPAARTLIRRLGRAASSAVFAGNMPATAAGSTAGAGCYPRGALLRALRNHVGARRWCRSMPPIAPAAGGATLWIVDREDGEWVGMPRWKAIEHALMARASSCSEMGRPGVWCQCFTRTARPIRAILGLKSRSTRVPWCRCDRSLPPARPGNRPSPSPRSVPGGERHQLLPLANEAEATNFRYGPCLLSFRSASPAGRRRFDLVALSSQAP
jgi:hypothetical protein